ncbi:AAA family ATPase [Rhizobium leguminosarum bv. trifolii]|uniref:ATP-binding protein n=1 Tax=Rhizobium leguminosarum TaxID=384 RepID=UPI000E2F4DE9|nr:ATP-binding protein [Rhizobium leguminosarum]RFB87112.1 AAA family ATPase [Rhizobium leguminosarum bv. trifolii]
MNKESSPPYYVRKVRAKIAEALSDTRVVLISGPRQAGKTTLAREFVESNRPYFTLDDTGTLQAARNDPIGFVRGLDKAVIDEVQRAPELMLALKESVDTDSRPGRFLLTGSANLMTMPAVADSLAGRMAVVSLLPLSQVEINGGPGKFLNKLFSGERVGAEGPHKTGRDLIDIVLKGGYPEALRRINQSRRRAWLDDYISLILDRDVRDIANIDQLDRLPRLLRILAEHASQLTNNSSFGSALSLSSVTAQKYVGILERLYLLKLLAPWSTNSLSRLIKTPKMHFLDSGLLAAVRDDDEERLLRDRSRFGPLLETFVVSEIMKIAAWTDLRLSFSHYRTKDQDEVDLVIEDRRGRVVGIEVKASATVRPSDIRGLRQLKATTGDRFLQGLILHDHDRVTPFDENISAIPISSLWML